MTVYRKSRLWERKVIKEVRIFQMGLWNKNAKYDETDIKVNRLNPILVSTIFLARLSTSMIEVKMNKSFPRTLMNVKDIPVRLLASAMKIVPRIKIINLSMSMNLDVIRTGKILILSHKMPTAKIGKKIKYLNSKS